MSRTRIALRVRSQLGAAEQGLVSGLTEYQKMGPELKLALKDLGLNGTVGDAAVARLQEVVDALKVAEDRAIEAHAEIDALRTGLGFRHVAGLPKFREYLQQDEEVRAA